MERRAFLGTLVGGLLAAPLAAEAEPAGKVYWIGWMIAVLLTHDSTPRMQPNWLSGCVLTAALSS